MSTLFSYRPAKSNLFELEEDPVLQADKNLISLIETMRTMTTVPSRDTPDNRIALACLTDCHQKLLDVLEEELNLRSQRTFSI